MNRGDEKAKGPSRVGVHKEKALEGSSTPVPETSTVRPSWRHKTEEKEGGGKGIKATTNKGTERSIQEVAENKGVRAGTRKHDITKDVRGPVGREGVPWDEAATSEVVEGTEVESTDMDVGEATYLFERVRRAERSTKRAMWPRKGRATSTRMISDEVRRMTVPNQGSGRGKISMDEEHAMRYPTDIQEERGFGQRSRAENE